MNTREHQIIVDLVRAIDANILPVDESIENDMPVIPLQYIACELEEVKNMIGE